MSFQNPAAFYLFFGALLILLLHFLRSRERRRDVSSMFLWEGLPGDPQSKAAQLRQQFDPLLLLQLAALAALTLALSQPMLRVSQRSISSLAIVIDGSASMRTQADAGSTRYQEAIEEAVAALQEYPADKTILIQLSEHPQLLAHPNESSDLAAILRRSSATWYEDGTAEGLLTMLGSVGGAAQFERILVLSDHPIAELPQQAELRLFDHGDNVGITAFSVRQDVVDFGMSAFVELVNDTAGYINTQIRISDGENQTTVTLMLSPDSIEQYIIPFPNSRGSVFTATLDHADALAADNQRFFALDRPIDIRVYWIGERNRYLLAALLASAPVTEVDDIAQADLVIVNQTQTPAIDHGAILLIQSGMDGILTLGELQEAGDITASSQTHPLLRSIDADDFRIREISEAQFEVPYESLLEFNGSPVLVEVNDSGRRLFFLLANLMDTNLPVTVDFPILIRNLAHELVRVPAELSYESPEVGDFIPLQGRGGIQSLTDADDRFVDYSQALLTFAPPEPGIYTLKTDKGAFPLTVNIPASETTLKTETLLAPTTTTTEQSERLYPVWPLLLALAGLLLLIEIILHLGLTMPFRRSL